MTSLTFYGGINEVGGNKILLESSKAKLWFDFGLSFSKMQMFYDEYMCPRKLSGLNDLIELGIIPKIKGLYRPDFVKKSGMKVEKPKFDGIFLTHAHMDHSGNIPLIDWNIPLYLGKTTSLILEAIEETGSGYETCFFDVKEEFTGLHYKKVPHFNRKYKTFRTKDKIKVKDVTVSPIHVDHSIPSAYGFIIDDGKRIVYTGDLRLHGTKPKMSKDFIDKASSDKVDALVIEGTRVSGEKSLSESEVKDRISKYIGESKGLVVANFPPRDMDRFNTFYKAAVENDRKLVINFKQAYLLKMLEEDDKLDVPKLNDKNILVYVKKMVNGLYQEKEYRLWMREFLSLKNAVSYKDIDPKDSVFYCDSYSFNELIDLKPVNGSYIYSLCEPFNDAMELDMDRFMNWIKHFKLKFNTAHASGHCSKEELKEIVNKLKPKKLIPVHTTDAIIFREFSKNIELVKVGEKVKV